MNRGQQRVWGVVLAGGYHWQADAIDHVIPRALLPLGALPLVELVLHWLRDAGVDGATICANSRSQWARQRLGDGERFRLPLHYYEDRVPRGPAGCARDAGLESGADLIVVSEGALVPRFDLCALLETHRGSEADLTVVADTERHDRAGADHLSPAGVYVCSRAVLEHVPSVGYQDIKEVLIPRLHRQKLRTAIFAPEARSLRVTDARSYLDLHEWLLEQDRPDAATFGNLRPFRGGWVHPTAQVAADVTIIGPVTIGPRTVIEGNAMLVGPVSVGQQCVIESGAVIARSVLWDRCRVGADAVVDRSILTHHALAHAGARVVGQICVAVPPRAPSWGRWLARRPAPRKREPLAAARDRAVALRVRENAVRAVQSS
jgi:mannose-1-phosphate guanylyltransferase